MDRFGYEASKAKVDAAGLTELWRRVAATPLIQARLQRWLSTGEGVESYPSDPRDPKNWSDGGAREQVEPNPESTERHRWTA